MAKISDNLRIWLELPEDTKEGDVSVWVFIRPDVVLTDPLTFPKSIEEPQEYVVSHSTDEYVNLRKKDVKKGRVLSLWFDGPGFKPLVAYDTEKIRYSYKRSSYLGFRTKEEAYDFYEKQIELFIHQGKCSRQYLALEKICREVKDYGLFAKEIDSLLRMDSSVLDDRVKIATNIKKLIKKTYDQFLIDVKELL
jgi:hypothetical protein